MRMAKKCTSLFLCFLLCFSLLFAGCKRQEAGENRSKEESTEESSNSSSVQLAAVHASLGEEEKNVLYEVLELESGMMGDVHFEVEQETASSVSKYRLLQYHGASGKLSEIVSSPSPSFDAPLESFETGVPVYLSLRDKNDVNLYTGLLTIRVNQGKAETMFPAGFESEYKNDITVSMEEVLPGMNFAMHPYILPITAKTYTDGRVVIGLGLNSSNVSFWKDARNGTLVDRTSVNEIAKIFWGDSQKKSMVSGKDMGLVVEFSGSVQGNIYTNEPMKGTLNAYVGSGFDFLGQYMILTWEVTVTVGVGGVFEFELRYNEDSGKYSEFVADRFSLQFKTGLELYGGIGIASLASLGIYGSGSVAGVNTFYPKGQVDSLILAGECGFKVKLFSRTLFSFALVSGSHEFADNKKNSGALLNFKNAEDLGTLLLERGYASSQGSISEPENAGNWYQEGQKLLGLSEGLTASKIDPDAEQLLAENIYPDHGLKTVQAGSDDAPLIQAVFLGSDPARENGNRARLMGFTFDEQENLLSAPSWLFAEDDGTADYSPSVYHSEKSGRTFLVWQNSTRVLSAEESFSDIAEASELCYSELQEDGTWTAAERLSGTESREMQYAAGAAVSEDQDGGPAVVYYRNRTEDPAGIDGNGFHDIYLLRQQDGEWTENGKAFEIRGVSIKRAETAVFDGRQTVALSYTRGDGSGKTVNRLELWAEDTAYWIPIFQRDNASNACYMKNAADGQAVLTWYENSALYMVDEDFNVKRLTPEEVQVPTADYELYGTLGSGTAVIAGTVSRDGSEDAYAIVSTDGGARWNRTELAEAGENASVSASSIAFTKAGEPIVLYSVLSYENRSPAPDAEALLSAPQKASFESLTPDGLMLGTDDPRFLDGETSLYIKARRANQKIRIEGGEFTDIESAKKGQDTPLRLDVKNCGLYDIDSVDLYRDGTFLTSFTIRIPAGAAASLEPSVLIPKEAPNAPLPMEIGIGSKGEIEDTERFELSMGNLYVRFVHELNNGTESLRYDVTSRGFAGRDVYVVLFNEDTHGFLLDAPLFVGAGLTATGSYVSEGGLFRENGLENIRAYIVTKEEYDKVGGRRYENFDDFEKYLKLESIRRTVFKSLDKIYLQDFDLLRASEKVE